MSSVFHYTSNDGAVGIINSGCLFATHYKYLNDASELMHARDIILPLFEEEFRDRAIQLIGENLLDGSFLTTYGTKAFESEALRLYESAVDTTDRLTPVFITSLCRHQEGSERAKDGLLSQWRGYGSNGGCALEIDVDDLEKKVAFEKDAFAFTNVFLADVLYGDHASLVDLSQLRGIADKVVRRIAGDTTLPSGDIDMHPLYLAIAILSPQMKGHAFSEEEEVRIIAPLMRPAAAQEHARRQRRPIHVRYRDSSPIPYIKLFEEEGGSLPIKRVIVGPQRNQAKVAYAIELALEARGSSAEVTLSSISYLP